MIDAHAISHIGGRTSQQDASCIIYDTCGYQVGIGIFDGVGAMADGASRSSETKTCACNAIGQHALGHLSPEIPSIIFEAIDSAQQQALLDDSDPYTASATTALIVIVVECVAFVAWVGDSKCWLLRNNRLHQITRPHTVAEEAWCNHDIARGEVDQHPDSHVITRAINSGTAQSQPDLRVIPVGFDDRLIVSSDGLDAVLDDRTIELQLNRHKITTSSEGLAADLLQASLQRNTPDNVSVGVIRILDPHQHMPELPIGAGAIGAIYDHQHHRLEQ